MSPWAELGIEATGDAGLIRKAYAARLKQTRPEDDPAGFARLRAAYEAALAMAPGLAARMAPPPAPAPKPTAPEPPAAPPIAAAAPRPQQPPSQQPSLQQPGTTHEDNAALRQIVAALDQRAVEEAAQLLLAAGAQNALPLRTEFGLKDRLAALLLADRQIPVPRLLEIARQFGWYDDADALRSRPNTAQGRLCARIDLELSRARQATAPPPKPSAQKSSGTGWIWLIVAVVLMVSRLVASIPHDPYSSLSSNGPSQQLPPSSLGLQPLGASPLRPPSSSSPDNPSYWQVGTPFMKIQAPHATSVCSLAETIPMPLLPDSRAGIFSRSGAAAVGGSAPAQNEMGLAYLAGKEVPQDYGRALSWFHLAAAQGNPDARRNLAEMCRRGLGTPADAAAARSLYLAGAQVQDPAGQLGLGEMLIAGDGGDADPATGFRWVHAAASASYVRAMAKLGTLYAAGIGTSRDPGKAAAWTKAAAEAGWPDAMQAYARMLAAGPDPAEAYRWQALAIRFGPSPPEAEATAALSHLAGTLPPQRKATLDKQVAAWRAAAPAPPAGGAAP